MMKRFFAVLLAVCMMAALFVPFAVSAEEAADYHYTYGDVEIVISADTRLTAEQRQAVATYLAAGGSDDSVATYGLWCTLFGHDWVTETVTRITHRAYATAPRCLAAVYSVNTCEDCGAVEETLVSSDRIECCE